MKFFSANLLDTSIYCDDKKNFISKACRTSSIKVPSKSCKNFLAISCIFSWTLVFSGLQGVSQTFPCKTFKRLILKRINFNTYRSPRRHWYFKFSPVLVACKETILSTPGNKHRMFSSVFVKKFNGKNYMGTFIWIIISCSEDLYVSQNIFSLNFSQMPLSKCELTFLYDTENMIWMVVNDTQFSKSA